MPIDTNARIAHCIFNDNDMMLSPANCLSITVPSSSQRRARFQLISVPPLVNRRTIGTPFWFGTTEKRKPVQQAYQCQAGRKNYAEREKCA
jgi:hypothetical protein